MKKHIKSLEDESISIIRETYSNAENPIVLYSIGKDSSVLMELFIRAFYPASVPVPFLHIDTGWKFKEMITFRDQVFQSKKIQGKVYTNTEGKKNGINPFENHNYTTIMKTDALKQALKLGKYDFVYGGARRDEEASRSKEKIVSHRDSNNRWDPKNQTIEPWLLFNFNKNPKESFRVFPLSNWTEINVWEYIESEKINVVPLYFTKKRNVVISDGQIFLLDDNRFKLKDGDIVKKLDVRFRTLGCYPLTAGVESNSKNVNDIIKELRKTKYSERSGRLIDHDQLGSMELKKRDGYF